MWLKYGNGDPNAEMPLMFDNDCAWTNTNNSRIQTPVFRRRI